MDTIGNTRHRRHTPACYFFRISNRAPSSITAVARTKDSVPASLNRAYARHPLAPSFHRVISLYIRVWRCSNGRSAPFRLSALRGLALGSSQFGPGLRPAVISTSCYLTQTLACLQQQAGALSKSYPPSTTLLLPFGVSNLLLLWQKKPTLNESKREAYASTNVLQAPPRSVDPYAVISRFSCLHLR